MKSRKGFCRVAPLLICVILLLSLAEVAEREPYVLHLASDGKRVLLNESDVESVNFLIPGAVPVMTRPLLENGPCMAIVAMLPGSSPPSLRTDG
jgi:hypothetical protein